ncbi:MAG: response regulator [Chitinophagaceae bacterium]
MNNPIHHIVYTDDDRDDHNFFCAALNQVRPAAKLSPFYRCDDLLEYLKDQATELPDLIFLDQNMLGNRDNECLKEIKTILRVKDIPVILYTTGANPKLEGYALSLGASKYVVKPIYHNDIKENLDLILTGYEQIES